MEFEITTFDFDNCKYLLFENTKTWGLCELCDIVNETDIKEITTKFKSDKIHWGITFTCNYRWYWGRIYGHANHGENHNVRLDVVIINNDEENTKWNLLDKFHKLYMNDYISVDGFGDTTHLDLNDMEFSSYLYDLFKQIPSRCVFEKKFPMYKEWQVAPY
jgi:hypothetical protein